MALPISERPGRGGLQNIRERLLANEAVDFEQELGLDQMTQRIAEMEQQAGDGDPGDLSALFLNKLI